MYAVIKTGGKQYKVAAGNLIAVGKLAGKAGDSVAFEEVLMVGDDKDPVIGSPLVAGAAVAGEIVEQKRTGKILVFKKRRRQNSKRSRGHRQEQTLVRVTEILTDGKKPAAKKAKASPAPAKAAAPAEAAAPVAETAAPETEAAPEPKAAPEKEAAKSGPAAKKADETKASTTAKARAPRKKAESAEADKADKAKPARKPRAKSSKTDKE